MKSHKLSFLVPKCSENSSIHNTYCLVSISGYGLIHLSKWRQAHVASCLFWYARVNVVQFVMFKFDLDNFGPGRGQLWPFMKLPWKIMTLNESDLGNYYPGW